MGDVDGVTSLGTMPWMVTLFGILFVPPGVVRVIHLRREVMELPRST